MIKFCHLAATSIHETLRRPQQIIPHDYLKILDLEQMTWVDEMRKKIGTDYASTCVVCIAAATERCGRGRATRRYGCIRSFHSIYNVVNRGVLLAGTCGQSWTPWSTHYLLTTPIWKLSRQAHASYANKIWVKLLSASRNSSILGALSQTPFR